jgi:sugar/nucleoside kinase (ribokinase family)
MSLVVVGSVALDTVETATARRDNALGGSATYFSCAASYFTQPRIIAVVGEDFPEEGRLALKSRGVDLSGLETLPGKTFRWAGRYEEDVNLRSTLSLELNVFEKFRPTLNATAQNAEFVFLANIEPDLQLEILGQVTNPMFVGMDTIDHWIDMERDKLVEAMPRIDATIINDGEARQLSGERNLVNAAAIIQEWGCGTVIIKKGEHGCLLFDGDGMFAVPAYPVDEVLDPTGAGDTFAGGFMGALARFGCCTPGTLRQAIVYGTAMASFCVESFSIDRLLDLTHNEIEDRVETIRRITAF